MVNLVQILVVDAKFDAGGAVLAGPDWSTFLASPCLLAYFTHFTFIKLKELFKELQKVPISNVPQLSGTSVSLGLFNFFLFRILV